MKKHLLPGGIMPFVRSYLKSGIFIFFFTCSLTVAQSQDKEIYVPSTQLKVTQTFKLHTARVASTEVVDPNAAYSDVSTFTGSGVNNGGAALQAGNTITTLIADSLGFIGTPPYTVTAFTFSVVNFDAADVTARPRIRFYAPDGPNGSPGTVISGFSFDPITFTSGSAALYNTGTLGTSFTVTTHSIWAGITFDNNTGTSGATLGQLNNLGMGVFDPPDRGSSTDQFFATDTAGSFLFDNPTGSDFTLQGGGVANFGWEIIASGNLPLTLSNFDVQRSGLMNLLSWSTSQELNSNYFAVERSSDGINFTQTGVVKASGNSSVVRNYQLTDANPFKGINYYRLRIVDIDNSIKYSRIITIRNNSTGNLSIFPNPVKSGMSINVDAGEAEMVTFVITDMSGRTVINQRLNLVQGNNNVPVDVSTLARGTYNFKMQLKSGSVTKKFEKL